MIAVAMCTLMLFCLFLLPLVSVDHGGGGAVVLCMLSMVVIAMIDSSFLYTACFCSLVAKASSVPARTTN